MQHTQDLTVAAAYASGVPPAQQRHASSAGRSKRQHPGKLQQLQTPIWFYMRVTLLMHSILSVACLWLTAFTLVIKDSQAM